MEKVTVNFLLSDYMKTYFDFSLMMQLTPFLSKTQIIANRTGLFLGAEG